MRYFEDMCDKFGFNDGEAVPSDAEAIRQVYIAVLNELGRRFGSAVRAYPYDRPGAHNGCMILFSPAGLPDMCGDEEPDEKMEEAIVRAKDMDLHQFVAVQCVVDSNALGVFMNSEEFFSAAKGERDG